MGDAKRLSIGDVVRRTGLTERTLRFYEQQGLLRPARTPAGRREYGAADLVTLHRITLLKRASFSLAQIKRLLAEHGAEPHEAALDAQIAALEAERKLIGHTLVALREARKNASHGAPIDVDTLCELIQHGERKMRDDAWLKVYEKHCTPEEQARWKAAKLKAAGGDWDAYGAKWNDLVARILAALPLDPGSPAAQALLAEWRSLLAPFSAALDHGMQADAQRFLTGIKDGSIEIDAPTHSDKAVWDFIESAREHAPK